MSVGESPEPAVTADHEEVVIVLVAIDTSAMASAVVDAAARFARRAWPNVQLHLLHVFPSTRFDRRAQAGLKTDELLDDAQSYLDHYVRMARRLFTGAVTGHLADGDPVDEIVRRAKSLSADWLLLGTKDPLGLERLLLGSIAEKVARSAPCSVIIVRKKRRPYVKVS